MRGTYSILLRKQTFRTPRHKANTSALTNVPLPCGSGQLLISANRSRHTYPLRKHNSQHEDEQQARGREPAVEGKRRDLVQKLLVLPLRLGILRRERLEWRF